MTHAELVQAGKLVPLNDEDLACVITHVIASRAEVPASTDPPSPAPRQQAEIVFEAVS